VQLASELRCHDRACAIENTPLALNEANADLVAMHGLAPQPRAILILTPWPGRENPNRELAQNPLILLGAADLLNVVIAKIDVDPTDQASAIDSPESQPQPESESGSTMITPRVEMAPCLRWRAR